MQFVTQILAKQISLSIYPKVVKGKSATLRRQSLVSTKAWGDKKVLAWLKPV